MSPLKRKLTFLIVIAAAAACAAGAYAATQSSGTSPRQAFLNDVAHRLHVTPAQLKRAMAGAFADRLAAMVASGRLTKAQAAAIKRRLARAGAIPGFGFFGAARFRHAFPVLPGRGPIPAWRGAWWWWYGYPPAVALPPGVKLPHMKLPPNAQLPPLPPGLMPLPGPPAMPFPFPPGPAWGFRALVPGGMKAVLSYLGIRPAQLMSQLRAGKSLAEIAKARGKSASGLEAVIASALETRLNRAVAAKRLTKAQAKVILRDIDARIAAAINLKWQPLPFRYRRLQPPNARRFRVVPHGAARQQAGALLSSD